MTPASMNLNGQVERLRLLQNQRREQNEKFLSTLPSSSACPHHPDKTRQRDDRQSCEHRRAVFHPCETCQREHQRQHEVERLQRMGVPLNLCGATFDNWQASGEQAEANLARVREFVATRRGFLILLGDLGTGKTHLAVAALRSFKSGLFVKQSELLRRLRQTYRPDFAAVHPVDEAQRVACLVLDEVGFSPGGKDELHLLHEILDYRHGNMKPTILTGNVNFDDLQAVIGDRMADRLRESVFDVLIFGGQSIRREARDKYFWKDDE